MLKIKCDINQQDLQTVYLHFLKFENFHSLEVVDRVSETQLQVGENFQLNNLAVKGLNNWLTNRLHDLQYIIYDIIH